MVYEYQEQEEQNDSEEEEFEVSEEMTEWKCENHNGIHA